MDLVFNNIRVYKVQKTGEFRDKAEKDVSLLCEYDPQGINIKFLLGTLCCVFHCANRVIGSEDNLCDDCRSFVTRN